MESLYVAHYLGVDALSTESHITLFTDATRCLMQLLKSAAFASSFLLRVACVVVKYSGSLLFDVGGSRNTGISHW